METAPFVRFKEKILENCGRVIIGKEEAAEQLAVCLIAGGHILLEDVPGTGKTMLLRVGPQHRRGIPQDPVHAGSDAFGPDGDQLLQSEKRRV